MSTTSEERREVAARLRENAEKRGVTLDYLGSAQVNSWWLLLNSIGCDSNHQEVAFNLIADLIDPTCEREDEDTDEDSQYRGTSLCSECGELLISQFRYCPHCGTRITSGGER